MGRGWASLTVVVILLMGTPHGKAADIAVCRDIAGEAGNLVDKSDSEQWRQSIDDEFSNVCSDTSRYESNLSSSSSGTQAAFGYAGFQLGFGTSASDADARKSDAIDKVCKTGKAFVESYFHSVDTRVSAQYAVKLIDDCIRIMAAADAEALTGTTEVSDASDTSFLVNLEFKPSSSTPSRKYALVDIVADKDAGIKCEAQGSDVRGRLVVTAHGQNAFACTRRSGAQVNGWFKFAPDSDSNPTRSLHFRVPSLGR